MVVAPQVGQRGDQGGLKMETLEDKMESNKTLTAAENNTQAGFLPSIQNNNLVDIRRGQGNQFSSEHEPNRQPLSINR